MIRAMLRKDWLLLWPMVALVNAIQIAIEWALIRSGMFGESAAAIELQRPLTIAWFSSVAALVVSIGQQDPIPGAEQDWLIRPVRRGDLLAAKILFIVATVSLPMFVLNLAHALAAGFSLGASLPAILAKDLYVLFFFMLPVLAVAATTRNMTELALLAAALMVAYAVGAGASAVLLGANRCPTCDTGLSWMEHLLQHTAVLCGAILILALQYFGRRTALSRAVALGGAALLVFVQLPWDRAQALQHLVQSGEAGSVMLEAASGEAAGGPAGGALSRDAPRLPSGGRQATRALLRGDVEQAVDILSRGARGGGVDLPIQVAGLTDQDIVLVDRLESAMLDAQGRVLYRGASPDESFMALRPSGGWPASGSYVIHQVLEVPSRVLAGPSTVPGPLELVYALTQMRVAEVFDMDALHGAQRSAEVGRCATRLEQRTVLFRCAQVGRAPFCFAATLQLPDGTQGAGVIKCWPDYRPYGAMLSTLTVFGADLPLTEPPADLSSLSKARVGVRFYRELAHVARRVISTTYRVIDAQ